MDGGLCGDPPRAPHHFARLLEGGGESGHRQGPGRESPGAGPPELPGLPSKRQGPFGQWHIAVLAPCALADPDQHALGVDSRDLQLGPFPEAKPARIDQPQTHPSFWVLAHGQQGSDLSRTHHDGQCLAAPGSHEGKAGPRALQRPLVAEPNPREVHAEGARGAFLLVQQEAELLTERRFAELVGSASRVASPWLNRGDRTLWGLGGQPPPLPVFEHTSSAGSHRDPPVRVGHALAQKAYGEQEDTGSLRRTKEGEKDSDLERID
jgi:hypothetical protein